MQRENSELEQSSENDLKPLVPRVPLKLRPIGKRKHSNVTEIHSRCDSAFKPPTHRVTEWAMENLPKSVHSRMREFNFSLVRDSILRTANEGSGKMQPTQFRKVKLRRSTGGVPKPKEEEEKRSFSNNSARSHAQPQIILSRLDSGVSVPKHSHDNNTLHPNSCSEHAGERGSPKQQSSEQLC